MSTFKPIGWSNCHDVRVAKSKQKWKNQEEKFISWNFALKTVDDTGIEPVTCRRAQILAIYFESDFLGALSCGKIHLGFSDAASD